MLKKLQERVNNGTEVAEETQKPEHGEESEKLAEKQLDIEELTRKVAEKVGSQ